MKKLLLHYLILFATGLILFAGCDKNEEIAPDDNSNTINIADLVESDNDLIGVSETVPGPYADVMSQGAKVVNLEQMNTFFVLWVPDNYESLESRRIMVIAHGHTGTAYREVGNELEFAKEYKYAIVAIQWWTGEGETMFTAEQFYEFMDISLQYMEYKYDAQINKCVYRGWSMGSEISFEVTYLDRYYNKDRIVLTISHDGGMMADPSGMSVGKEFTTNLYNGVYGDTPFAGTRFYLYAGQPGQVNNMINTKEVIMNFGGEVVQLIEDPDAGHDGFYRHPQYHIEAIEIFIGLTP